MIFAWLILKPFKFLACDALMILMVRTSFMSLRLTGRRIDLGLPEPIGVTRINCLILRFPLHVMLRTFIVLLFSWGVTRTFGTLSRTRRNSFSLDVREIWTIARSVEIHIYRYIAMLRCPLESITFDSRYPDRELFQKNRWVRLHHVCTYSRFCVH